MKLSEFMGPITHNTDIQLETDGVTIRCRAEDIHNISFLQPFQDYIINEVSMDGYFMIIKLFSEEDNKAKKQGKHDG